MVLQLLRTFLVVCEEGNLTRAAVRLYRTQPALSQQIAVLERELGHVLLHRSARGVSPTAEGKLLRTRAVRLFAEWSALEESLAGLAAGTQGELQIACSDTIARYFLAPLLGRFVAAHPKVRLSLRNGSTGEIVNWLIQGIAEVGFVLEPVSQQGLKLHRAFDYRHVAIFPKDHALARQRRVDARTLARLPLVLLARHTHTRRLLEEGFLRQGTFPEQVLEVGSVSVQKEMVRVGLGVGILPDYAVVAEDVLAFARIEGAPLRHISLAQRQGETLSGAATQFLALVAGQRPHRQRLPKHRS